MEDLIPLSVAASKLGCTGAFLRKKCLEGSLPSMLVGNKYRVRWEDVLAVATRTPTKKVKQDSQIKADLGLLIESWLSYLTHAQALSPKTVALYQSQMRSYFKRLSAVGQRELNLDLLFDRQTVLAVFSQFSPESYSTKMNTYLALRSLGMFLIAEGKLTHQKLDDLKPLKPRRQVEPRRTHLKPDEVPKLFDAILLRQASVVENTTFAAMVACMVYGGLRVSEVCQLSFKDVDLDERVLTIIHGKGGKNRRVGITNSLYAYLVAYQRIRSQGIAFFVHPDGEAWERYQLAKRIRTLSKRLGVDITCHGLRRTFATLAANQGRSINSIRIALGHSNLETTQAYLRTSEAEVVEQMKDW